MSSAKGSGGGRTRAQAYQNRTTFRHNKGSKRTAKILATANSGGLCKRCADKIDWRIKYRKYKPLSQPGLCNGCNQRTVKAAYRTLCEPCAKERKACPQCAQVKGKQALTPKVQTKAEEAREYEYLEGVVETLRERDRRTVYRKVARGDDVLAPLGAGGSDNDDDSSDDGSENSDGDDSEGDGSDDSDGGKSAREGDIQDFGEPGEPIRVTIPDVDGVGDGAYSPSAEDNVEVEACAREQSSLLSRDLSSTMQL